MKHPEAAAAQTPEDVRRVQEEINRPDPKLPKEIKDRLEAIIRSSKKDA